MKEVELKSLSFSLVVWRNAPVNKTLDDRHLRLLELLLRVTASSVREVDGVADLDVVRQRDILNLNTIPVPIPIPYQVHSVHPSIIATTISTD